MVRLLLAILLVLSTCAVVAHGILFYQVPATEVVLAEEESTGDQPFVKEAKEVSKEAMGLSLYLYRRTLTAESCKTALHKTVSCPKGVYNRPYNPPDPA
jgi:hypothetical protein